jgi:uncharacterized protein (DUF1778 family)
MARANQSKVRVVLSLHLPRQQHQRYAKAAKAEKLSLSEYLRRAASERADRVIGDASATDVAA